MGGCQFYMDYGPDVEVQQVLTPLSGGLNWTVAPGFKCTKPQCTLALSFVMLGLKEPRLAPNYRHAYKDHPPTNIYRNNFEFIHEALPEFHLEMCL